jgi:hypothetical protein
VIKNHLSIRDRNHAAYLLTLGFTCEFRQQAGGVITAEFEHSEALDRATRSYMSNQDVPVQTFVAASRYISDRIRDCRKAVSAC